MKKALKVVAWIGISILTLALILVALLIIQFYRDKKIQEIDQVAMIKSDEELIGEHLYIERENLSPVDVNYYSCKSETLVPLVINIHGGAFIAGDADTLDTQSDRISKNWNVNVVTVNYSLMKNGITQDYALAEITDTVKYFIANAEIYHIDPERIYIMGYSAGGYYAMAATLALQTEGIYVKGQIPCYAFLGDIVEHFNNLSEEEKSRVAPVLFVIADGDPLGEGSLVYQPLLEKAGVSTKVLVYANVKHGFLEENNPEYGELHEKNRASKSEEAEVIARQAEKDIGLWIEMP